jgi:hypothetical protein
MAKLKRRDYKRAFEKIQYKGIPREEVVAGLIAKGATEEDIQIKLEAEFELHNQSLANLKAGMEELNNSLAELSETEDYEDYNQTDLAEALLNEFMLEAESL